MKASSAKVLLMLPNLMSSRYICTRSTAVMSAIRDRGSSSLRNNNTSAEGRNSFFSGSLMSKTPKPPIVSFCGLLGTTGVFSWAAVFGETEELPVGTSRSATVTASMECVTGMVAPEFAFVAIRAGINSNSDKGTLTGRQRAHLSCILALRASFSRKFLNAG